MKKMSVKEIKNVINEVLSERLEKRGRDWWVWRDEYETKKGVKVRLKWWHLIVSDEEIGEIRKRIGEEYKVGRNRGGGWKSGGDLVISGLKSDFDIKLRK